jgi:peptidoglycan/xylan/chitin deacetylase (PgdA/CDA1 family)
MCWIRVAGNPEKRGDCSAFLDPDFHKVLMMINRSLAKKMMSSALVLFGNIFSRRCFPVLAYHSIDGSGSVISTSPDDFKKQMAYLKRNGYRTISLEEYLECLCGRKKQSTKNVVLTFDDALSNCYTKAFPVLQEYRFCATVFVPTGYVGRTSGWEKLATVPHLPLLSWDQIQEMSVLGINFESHTRNHRSLIELDDAEIEFELKESKETLEGKLNKPVRFLCHPYEESNDRTQRIAKDCGYFAAFGSHDFACVNSAKDRYQLKREGAEHFNSLWDFKAGLLGTYEFYAKIRESLVQYKTKCLF